MALTITDTEKDLVSQRVLRLSRSAASAAQQVQIDYACNMALNRVNQYAQLWLGVDDTGDAYSANNQSQTLDVNPWLHWWVAEASWGLSLAYKPEFAGALKDAREESIEDCFRSFSDNAIDSTTMDGTSITLLDVRRSIVTSCIKRHPRRVFPDMQHVNQSIKAVVEELWSRCRWDFTRRRATLEIPAASLMTAPTLAVTDGGDGVMDGVSSKYLTIRSSGNSPEVRCQWIDASRAAILRADTDAATGTPQYYRYYDDGDDTMTWEFFPAPDATYTADLEIFIKPPEIVGSTTTATASVMQRFPHDFRPVIISYALAKVLMDMNASGSQAYFDKVRMQYDPMLQGYADRGVQDDDQAIGDVYHDDLAQRGYDNYGGVPGLGWGNGGAL